jgi:hypothetical protein
MPGYWLEVSMHPDGPAAGQLDQGFLCPRAELVPKFHVALSISNAAFPMLTKKFRPNPVNTLIIFSLLFAQSKAGHSNCFTFFTSQCFIFSATFTLLEGRAGTEWAPSWPESFYQLPPIKMLPLSLPLSPLPLLSLRLVRLQRVKHTYPSI